MRIALARAEIDRRPVDGEPDRDPDRDHCQQLVVDRRVRADHHRDERGEATPPRPGTAASIER
jgi:hypothetical protein